MNRSIWEGVYKYFNDVPEDGPGHNGSEWITNSRNRVVHFRELARKERTIPVVTAYRESLLPVVASLVYADFGSVKILDFGGGLGFAYYQVVSALPGRANIEFHIIELQEICDAGKEFFHDQPGIFFHAALPELESFHIIHIGSSLQYVEDWKGMIRNLCAYQPGHLLFTDLPAGDITTYASAQYYYGSMMPCWFFSISEVMDEISEHGYELVFKASYVPFILNKEQPYPMDNFDEEYRIDYPATLIFRKRENK